MTPGNSYDSSSITDDLGETWAIMDLGIKPYPCGRITHTAIEAMRELVETESLTPEDIECIHVTLEKAAEDLMTYDRPSTPEEGERRSRWDSWQRFAMATYGQSSFHMTFTGIGNTGAIRPYRA
ncbi:hypothetical protein D8S78_22865 [Natrialba swarupiae]|nr:hypothetical protein [Natrialba swarupiae]